MNNQCVADKWGWFLAFGVLLVLLGFVALSAALAVTLWAMVFYGLLLLMGAAGQFVHAFYHRDWAGFFLALALGGLYTLAGTVLLAKPLVGAIFFTLILGLCIAFNGAARIALSFMHRRFIGWLMMTLSGIVSLFLAGIILANWPESSLYIIGLFIGVDLLVSGASWIALAMTARQFCTPSQRRPLESA